MIGVQIEVDDLNRLRKLGYHIIDEDKITYIIDKDDKKIAEISVNKKGLLSIQVGGEKKEKLDWVTIYSPIFPKGILMELKHQDGTRGWCEIPVKENQPVFW